MNIVNLLNVDFNRIMDLFVCCFKDDPYYNTQLGNGDPDVMRMSFGPIIQSCVGLGDCFGICEKNHIIAIIICFKYKELKNSNIDLFYKIFNGKGKIEELPYQEAIHETLDSFSEEVVYCVSIAVSPEYRRQGLGAGLIDYILQMYPQSSMACDVSNKHSLPIYSKRNFSIREIDELGSDEKYYFIVHRYDERKDTFGIGSDNKLRLIVPSANVLLELRCKIGEEKCCVLFGYTIEKQFNVDYFVRDNECICEALSVLIEYDDYLKYQRFINVMQYEEHFYGDAIFYSNFESYNAEPLFNDVLRTMILNRNREWSIIPDVYISIPVEYSNIDHFVSLNVDNSICCAKMLKLLSFRTNYEAGVPSIDESVDDLSGFKNRIERFFLGNVKVQIKSESSISEFVEDGLPIGPAAIVGLYVSIDKRSNCAVLTIISLSSPFLISQLLDNVIRNQIIVDLGDRQVNLYDYLKYTYGISKRGTPKAFVMIPKEKECLSNNQIASLLAAETIYPDGESFGEIIDPAIISAVEAEYGLGQYNRGFVCAYSNVVIQFLPEMQSSVHERMIEESITLFYIELILFEESAICIATHAITQLLTREDFLEPIRFLENVNRMQDDFSKTIDFWNIQVNYPTSQMSIDMLRKQFDINKKIDIMHRNQEQLQTIYNTKSDIIDRKDSKRMDTSLAIISVFAIFSAWVDGHTFVAMWDDILHPTTIHILQRVVFVLISVAAGYAITHLIGNRISMFIKLRRKRRKNPRR